MLEVSGLSNKGKFQFSVEREKKEPLLLATVTAEQRDEVERRCV